MRRLQFSALNYSLNAFAAVVTIVLAVLPDSRAWLLRHAGLGWLVCIALLVVLATLVQVLVQRGRATVARITDLEARVPHDQDSRLLAEWLDGWTQGGEFMRWLDIGFAGFYMPDSYAVDVARRVEMWAADDRKLIDPRLASAFALVSQAAAGFNDATYEMWTVDGTDRLEVPREWKSEQPDRYANAVHQLMQSGVALRSSLAALFAEMHAQALS